MAGNHFLDYSLGSIELGVCISCVLYGITSCQVYIYYSQSKIKDPIRIRLIVPFVWIIETVQTISTIYYLYNLTVTNFGDVELIGQGSWSLNTSALYDGIIGAIVQSFFAHRIHVLSGKWAITIISWIGSFLALMGTTSILILGQISYIAKFISQYEWLVTTTLVMFTFVDILNTVALCNFLRVERTGFRSTDGMLNKLFLWTIQTGIITCIGALTMMILSLAMPDTSLWIGISLFYGKLYSNALMATLNGRESLRVVLAKSDLGSTVNNQGPMQFATMRSQGLDDLEMQTQTYPKSKVISFQDSSLQSPSRDNEDMELDSRNSGDSTWKYRYRTSSKIPIVPELLSESGWLGVGVGTQTETATAMEPRTGPESRTGSQCKCKEQ